MTSEKSNPNELDVRIITLTKEIERLKENSGVTETSMRETVNELRDQVRKSESKYRELETCYLQMTGDKYAAEDDLESSKEDVEKLNVKLQELNATVEELQADKLKLVAQIRENGGDLKMKCQEMNDVIKRLEENLKTKEHDNLKLRDKIDEQDKEYDASIKTLRKDLEAMGQLNLTLNTKIRKQDGTVQSMEEELQSRDQVIKELNEKLNKKSVQQVVKQQLSVNTQTEELESDTNIESEPHTLLAEEILRQHQESLVKVTDSNNKNSDDDSWRVKVEEQLKSLTTKVEFLTQENLKLQLNGLVSGEIIGANRNNKGTPDLSNLFLSDSRPSASPVIESCPSRSSSQTLHSPPCNDIGQFEVLVNSMKPQGAPGQILNGFPNGKSQTRAQQQHPTPLTNPESIKVGHNSNFNMGERKRQFPNNGYPHFMPPSSGPPPPYVERPRSGRKPVGNQVKPKPKTAGAADYFEVMKSKAAATGPQSPLDPLMSIPLSKNVPNDLSQKSQVHNQDCLPIGANNVGNSSAVPKVAFERRNGNPPNRFPQPSGPPQSNNVIESHFVPTQALAPRKTNIVNKNVTRSVPTETRNIYQLLSAKQRLDLRNGMDLIGAVNAGNMEGNDNTMQAVPVYEYCQQSFQFDAGEKKFTVHFWLTQRMVESSVCIPDQMRICFPKKAKDTNKVISPSYGNCFLKVKFFDRQGTPVCSKIFRIPVLQGSCENTHDPHVNCSQATYVVDNFEFFNEALASYWEFKRSNVSLTTINGFEKKNNFFPLEVELFFMIPTGLEFPMNTIIENKIASKQVEIWNLNQSKDHSNCWKIPLLIEHESGEDVYDIEPCLLGAYSPIFEKISEQNWEENGNKRVFLPNVNKCTIHTFIAFIHGNQIKFVKVKEILELLKFSYNYLIADLAQLCSEKLIQAQDEEYQHEVVMDLKEISLQFGNVELQQRAQNWLKM